MYFILGFEFRDNIYFLIQIPILTLLLNMNKILKQQYFLEHDKYPQRVRRSNTLLGLAFLSHCSPTRVHSFNSVEFKTLLLDVVCCEQKFTARNCHLKLLTILYYIFYVALNIYLLQKKIITTCSMITLIKLIHKTYA